jgi:hypothetical protein
MVCALDTKDIACSRMTMEGVYLLCSETLVFLLFVGGMMSTIIDNWQSQGVGFVMFYLSNVVSFVVMASCTGAAFQGYLHKAVLLVARGALIFNVVIFCSFLLTAHERQENVQIHKMNPLLFKVSMQDTTGLTISYLLIAISFSVVLLLLHCCIYQQLHDVVAEFQSQEQYAVYRYVNRVADLYDESTPDSTSPETDSATIRRILGLFADVKTERDADSETLLELLQVVARTFLLVLCVLYDMKACLEDDTKNGYLELAPSVVFVSSFAFVDGMRHVYMHWHLRPMWTTALFCLLMSSVLGHSGVVAGTVLFYINSDWQSSYLSDAERTWLNNALVGFLILDLVLDLYSWFLVFLLHRERRPGTPLVPTAVVTQQPAGKTQALLGQSTSLGGRIRVVGLPTTRHVAFDMGRAYKKNK